MARNFDGTNGYLSHPDGDILYLPSAWSLSLWVNFDALGGNTVLASHALSNPNVPLVMALGNGGAEAGVNIMYTGFYNGGWRVARWGTPPTGRWLHCVGIWDGTNISLWVDAKLVGRNSGGSGTPAAPSADTDFWLGRNWGGTPYLDGRMDHVAIWNRELLYREILALTKGESPLSMMPLTYWPMKGGSTEFDLTPRHMLMSAVGGTGPAMGVAQEMVVSAMLTSPDTTTLPIVDFIPAIPVLS